MRHNAVERPEVRILVAGGAGFVGSMVTRLALQAASAVGVLDNYHHGSRDNLAAIAPQLAFDVRADATDYGEVLRALSYFAPSHLISCIGDTFVQAAYDQPRKFVANNLLSTLNLLLAAKATGVQHVLYVSSTEVYGDQPGRLLNEAAALDPVNTYAVSKLAADRLCATFATEHHLRVTVARIFNTYGPRETHAYIVPEIIDQLSRSSLLRLGNVAAARDFTYVADTARALLMLLLSKELPSPVYNVGSGSEVSVAELVEIVAAEMRCQSPTIIIDQERIRKRDIQSFRCDYSRLARDTGWRPEVPLREGLRLTINWFRQNGSRWPWKTLEEEVTDGATGIADAYSQFPAISLGN